jgi:hypothetical protein
LGDQILPQRHVQGDAITMERRRFERVAVNFNVALLDERAMPRGCRVRDVSAGGMLLQFHHAANGASYTPGGAVQIRLSVKQGERRHTLLLPAAVRRVEENGLGVEFTETREPLMELLEPYQLDRQQEAAPAAAVVGADGPSPGVAAPASNRPQRRRRDTAAAPTAARRPPARPAMRAGLAGIAPPNPATARSATGDRRMLMVGLASLAVAAAIVVFDLASSAGIHRRLGTLEAAVRKQALAIADTQIRVTADRAQASRISDLDARMNQLEASVAALEPVHITHTTALPDKEPARRASGEAGGAAEPAPTPPGRSPPVEGKPRPPKPAAHGGRWVINLASLQDEAAATQFAQRAARLGIPVESNRTLVKGAPVWRLQISGFGTREEAAAYGDAHKARFGLKTVWIFRR